MYVKLFASLYQGTLRGCTNEILVFTYLLAHCDSKGFADIHWRSIAEGTGLDKDSVIKAIKNLEAPDQESRSPEEDGRRIALMDEHREWGWRIVNHGKYRDIKNEDDRREQNRLAQERWRNKDKRASANVSTNKQSKPIQKQKKDTDTEADTHTEADSDAKALKPKPKPKSKTKAASPLVEIPSWIPFDAWQGYAESRNSIKKPLTPAATLLAIKTLEKLKAAGNDPAGVLEQSTLNGWAGLFELKRGNGIAGGNMSVTDHNRAAVAEWKAGKEKLIGEGRA